MTAGSQDYGAQVDIRRARAQGAHAHYRGRTEVYVRRLLTVILYLALWRATGMWYGYPSRFLEGVSVDPTAQKVMLYSLIPLLGLYVLFEPRRFFGYFTRMPLMAAGVIAACLASLVVSIDLGASLRGIMAVAILTAAPLLYRLRYGGAETFRALANFAIVSAFANILYTVAFPQFAVMGGSYAGDVKGLFYHKNGLGQFSAVGFLILFSGSGLYRKLDKREILRKCALVLSLLLVVIAHSSTAIVMVFTGVALLFGLRMLQKIGDSLLRSIIVLTLCIVVGVLGSYVYLTVAEAIASAFGKDLTFSGRSDIWNQLIPLIYDRPLLGYGFATFRQSYIIDQYVHLGHGVLSIHNTYIELCLNIGVPATITWCVYLIGTVFQKIGMVQREPLLQEAQAKDIVIILLIMIGSMTEAGLMLAPVILWPFLAAALPSDRPRTPSVVAARPR
ncbi:lipid A core-O-antigen ligase-like enyme [Caulobacter sp. AP07]|uniref:O-antigen ligase family protein n=1 Tax=Caulobacter sp. AP07 TaxID=1144304 RepID=UPI000271EDA7|nr:O-antigen ligase family protein [Caulobacter sp. AP07]EJL34060.1 lipid A core-O-antigen ligase-like enyme [Caulobacter sp. AP07]